MARPPAFEDTLCHHVSMYSKAIAAVSAAIITTVSLIPLNAAQQPGARAAAGAASFTISQVTTNLYKVNSGPGVSAVTVFLVTSDGIVLADPNSPELAAWLRGELAQRFPGRPVRWVIYTHYHYDHARGGGIFSDTANYLAHENMRVNLRSPIAQAPPPGATTDVNGDNQLTPEEAPGGMRNAFARYDTDKDGYVSQEEQNADIRWPGVVFKDQHTITLGGQQVQAIWAKNRHTTDNLDIYFPGERVLFASDYIWINRICCGFEFDRRPMETVIESIKALEALDFAILVNSHFEQGTKQDLINFRFWLEDLKAAVEAGIKDGRSVDELVKTITLDQYKTWAGYTPELVNPEGVAGAIRSAYGSLTRWSRR
jgi:glyoxylase-like metal-dependent hydrolase (beta-lactamase superfamily II)